MRKLIYSEIKECIENEQGYELISKTYINSKTKMEIKCPNGHIFNMSYEVFKVGHRCPICSTKKRGNSRKLSYDYVKTFIEKEGYSLISKEYKNNNTKLELICDKGHNIQMTFGNFQRGNRCKICATKKNIDKQRHSYEYVKSFIKSIGYTLIDEKYVRNSDKLKIRCDKGHEISTSFKNLLKGNRCPECGVISHGEEKIKQILERENISFEIQYTFKDCKFKKVLPFDFYLKDKNILIEYDGIQHFEIREYFGGLNSFIDTKIRDTIKNIYCKENNIKLIRIPYWKFESIEEILKVEKVI